MLEKLKSKLFNSPEWVIAVCVFFVYWLVNKSYTGPIILDDEIGYLANAALISGHVIDGASKYHAGYSFFIAPFFAILSEPSQIWQAIMIFNAFIWSISFILLARILKMLMPECSSWKLFVALLIAAVYPTWITMAGYVFTTTAFVFVYLISILSFLHWKPDKGWTIIPHALAVGYLYWIHPVGMAVCVASFMVVGFASIKENKHTSFILNFMLIIILITVYREVVEGWLTFITTPEGYSPISNYPGSERIIGGLFDYKFWLRFVSKTAGQVSYLIVSSFGLIYFGFITSIAKSSLLFKKHNEYNGNFNLTNHATFAFLALSLVGVLAMGVIFFSVGTSSRIDHWIYGRYVEMVVLPLLTLGYLSTWHKKSLVFAVLFVFFTGILLNQIADREVINLTINTVAFWPQYLIAETNYLYWMIVGSLLFFIVGRVKCKKDIDKLGNVILILFLTVFFIFPSMFQRSSHYYSILAGGRPSTLVNVVREYYPQGTCVGLNPEGLDSRNNSRKYKHPLHLFYLYDYNYRRMSPEEWLKNCDGPYFTYYIDELYGKEGVNLVGKEMLSNIYLLVKDDGPSIIMSDKSKYARDVYLGSDWSLNYRINCEGNQLRDLAGPAGFYEDGSIFSLGTHGFILLDYDTKLGTGKYSLLLRGEAPGVDSAWIDIVSRGSENEYAKFDILDSNESGNAIIASGTFMLEEPVPDLAFRVYVNSTDDIRIDGYTIEYKENIKE